MRLRHMHILDNAPFPVRHQQAVCLRVSDMDPPYRQVLNPYELQAHGQVGLSILRAVPGRQHLPLRKGVRLPPLLHPVLVIGTA